MTSLSIPTNASTDSAKLFITATAWISIVIAVISIAYATVLNIIFNVMMSPEAVMTATAYSREYGRVSPIQEVILRHYQLWLLALLAYPLALLVSSIGLLQRKSWALQLYVALIALIMLMSLIWLAHGAYYLHYLSTMQTVSVENPSLSKFFALLIVVPAAIAFSICSLGGVVIFKLLSERCLDEFNPAPASAIGAERTGETLSSLDPTGASEQFEGEEVTRTQLLESISTRQALAFFALVCATTPLLLYLVYVILAPGRGSDRARSMASPVTSPRAETPAEKVFKEIGQTIEGGNR